MKKNITTAFVLSVILLLSGCSGSGVNENRMKIPGKYDDHVLLPNGWKLTPAGKHVDVGDLPLNMILSEDEKYAVVSNSGMRENSLMVIDTKTMEMIEKEVIDKTWRGLAFDDTGTELYVSGGNNNAVYIYDFNKGSLALKDSLILADRWPDDTISVTGVDYHVPSGNVLAATKDNYSLYIIDREKKEIIKQIKFEDKLYDVKINHAGTHAYVSEWAEAYVSEIDLTTYEVTARVKVGDHPCEILISSDDGRLFVTNANNNTTSVIDLKLKKETEKINSALAANTPYGSTPNAVCFNDDESVLIIANADNNYLALFDITEMNESRSLGFIPVGWYPTSVKYLKGSDKVISVNGKGLASQPNPEGPSAYTPYEDRKLVDYIGMLFTGTVSFINYPTAEQLEEYSLKVYDNTPYIDKEIHEYDQSVISAEHNLERSKKIKYVFYIIKENRTYDHILGDIPEGNGDSSLCIFPEKITPNHHKLAKEFVLFDNFYVDAEVSADGHNWSTAAYATDYVEKNWPVLYGGRGGEYDFEGGDSIGAPSSGYIWDNVLKAGMTFRNYGEFIQWPKEGDTIYHPQYSYMEPYTCNTFPPYNLSISDITRFEKWEEDFEKFEESGDLPEFNIMRLPNDHTAGTRPGSLTPEAFMAQNDYALGLFVERLSNSRFWDESIVFVVEDDAQNGSDHVDAHRSVLFVIGPHVKRGYVDNNMYSTSSVLKTIELILGLPPMTQFDFSANPILAPITDDPDLSKYKALEPNIDITKKNPEKSYGSERCKEMNLAVEDAIPDVEFNEIIWKAVKGEDSEMPAPVRSAFVKISEEEEDED